MKVLIIESDVYLSQSIEMKLNDKGYDCERKAGVEKGIEYKEYDVILLSTTILNREYKSIVEENRESIIILMTSTINEDSVFQLINAGAMDYILKPFITDELLRKVEHFEEHKRIKRQHDTFERYIEHTFTSIEVDCKYEKSDLPIFIYSNYQKNSDAFAFKLVKDCNTPLNFMSMDKIDIEEIGNLSNDQLTYITGFQEIRKKDRKKFLELIKDKSVIVSSTNVEEDVPYESIELKTGNNIMETGEISPIEDYVKSIILNYQHKYPDTELSKRLGISRKCLWEKRKKFGIKKKREE